MLEHERLMAVVTVGMAAMGSLARIFNSKKVSRPGFVLADMFVSAFAGLILFWVTRSWDIEQGWMFALAGVLGWIGPRALDWLQAVMTKSVGIQLSGKMESEEAASEYGLQLPQSAQVQVHEILHTPIKTDVGYTEEHNGESDGAVVPAENDRASQDHGLAILSNVPDDHVDNGPTDPSDN